MFGLVRRISYGLIPRADRPWEEDPTSNAPQRRKKRRLSSTERPDIDADEEAANKKKARGESGTPDADGDAAFLTPPPATGANADTQEVKEVTQGVKKVDLDGRDATPAPVEEEDKSEVAPPPESIPLPDEKSGELDEPSSDASTPPAQSATIADGEGPPSSAEAASDSAPAEEGKEPVFPSDQEIATAEKGLKDAATIVKSVDSSVSPAGVTISQN